MFTHPKLLYGYMKHSCALSLYNTAILWMEKLLTWTPA